MNHTHKAGDGTPLRRIYEIPEPEEVPTMAPVEAPEPVQEPERVPA